MGQSASSRRWREGAAGSSASSAGGVGLACALSVELSPITLPASCAQLPTAGLDTPRREPTEQSSAAAAAASAQIRAPRAVTAQWLLPAPGSAAGSVPAAEHAETAAAQAANTRSDAAPGVVAGDAALRGAQLAATRRELDGARDRILALLQQVVATQAARDRALEQANQQVGSLRSAGRIPVAPPRMSTDGR